MGLDKIQLRLDITNGGELEIHEYAISLEGPPTQEHDSVKVLPNLKSCLVGERTAPFLEWVQKAINILISGAMSEVRYNGRLLFRPPTVACASSRVLLCAGDVRLIWSYQDFQLDDAEIKFDCSRHFELQLGDVTQVIPHRPGTQASHPRLPALIETGTSHRRDCNIAYTPAD